MIDSVVPPGVPTVDNAGPLFPALETKMMPCLVTVSRMMSQTRLKQRDVTDTAETTWCHRHG